MMLRELKRGDFVVYKSDNGKVILNDTIVTVQQYDS